jgi:phosphoribosylformylglycinamidine synthase
VPVADVAVTASDFAGFTGEAMAMGERTPVALLNPVASGRMAIGEAITNIAAAAIDNIGDIKLSANWMAAAGHPGEDAALFDTVEDVGKFLCPELGIAIPVGKDSLSMKTVWQEKGEQRQITAPLSLIISAFAPVSDVRRTLTPQLHTHIPDTDLILIDLGDGKNRLGGSALAQVYKQIGDEPPNLEVTEKLKLFFHAIQTLNSEDKLLAYHDRSDGGLLATICEMAFAGHTGVDVQLEKLGADAIAALFTEELGAVIQIVQKDEDRVEQVLNEAGLSFYRIGRITQDDRVSINHGRRVLFSQPRAQLQSIWSETNYRMQALRDNPECARQEFELLTQEDPGMLPHVNFDPQENVAAALIRSGNRPPVAILREQGVNGHVEMAAAFDLAGFAAIDVHMTDIIEGRVDLSGFTGLVACGGFSYGDVLGAGGGWAKSILFNDRAREAFETFFAREDVFGLGVCNGCQMFSQLKSIIPGADHWPYFRRNLSEQFEGRYSLVEVMPSPSIFLKEMQGSHLPIAVAHGEGRAVFTDNTPNAVLNAGLVSLRYIDHHGHATEHYPENPNGSPLGITGLTTPDGRFTIMMPHPERVFRTLQHSWHPDDWSDEGPWLRMFRNARVWVN